MTQTPINYWYCPQCECEVDNRNVTNDEKHDNCGAEVESRQHVQTPIELAIAELKDNISNIDLGVQYTSGMLESIRLIRSILPYEKQYLRDVAEKAWDDGADSSYLNTSGLNPELNMKRVNNDKQTYLNQNHPL